MGVFCVILCCFLFWACLFLYVSCFLGLFNILSVWVVVGWVCWLFYLFFCFFVCFFGFLVAVVLRFSVYVFFFFALTVGMGFLVRGLLIFFLIFPVQVLESLSFMLQLSLCFVVAEEDNGGRVKALVCFPLSEFLLPAPFSIYSVF